MAPFARRSLLTSIFAVALLIGARPASALTIDLAASSWSGANNQTSYSSDGVTVTALPDYLSPVLTYDSTYGLGIQGLPMYPWIDLNPDEINQLELMRIDFAPGTTVNSFTVSKLFFQELSLYNEYGFYSLDGVTWTQFQQNAADPLGLFTVNVGAQTTSLYLSVHYDDIIVQALDFFNDFSLKSIDVTPARSVPDGASTLAMMFAGLGVLGAASRRFRGYR